MSRDPQIVPRARRSGRRIAVALALLVCASLGRARSNEPSREQLGDRRSCARYGGVPDGFPSEPTAGMIWIEGGEVTLGSSQGYPEERGAQRLQLPGFWIDRTEVTNAQFARFVAATGYVTVAERAGAAPVFHSPTERELRERGNYAWWADVEGASWRHPEGPTSSIVERAQHPVVQVAHEDALAYAHWLGRTLPSEAQWEYAAKAARTDDGLHREPRDARGTPLANFWQGAFPTRNEKEDGFATSAPVGCFAENPFGLFDMLGNVWEWTGSSYTSSHRDEDRRDAALVQERQGAAGIDVACSAASPRGARLVLKGGSFLCSADFCARYRVAARHAQEASQPAMHVGFRTVRTGR